MSFYLMVPGAAHRQLDCRRAVWPHRRSRHGDFGGTCCRPFRARVCADAELQDTIRPIYVDLGLITETGRGSEMLRPIVEDEAMR